ncbi:MAG TPA: hypothetical protein PLI05_04720 [Methanotrichaceae archaeon]|nr:hypothetical protein [Methanotrichaceae archaeon]HQF16354.1 hypothetical protein [Methanotrichaceae archaeon]
MSYPEKTVEAVMAYVNATTWEHKKNIVRANRGELLTDTADSVLNKLIEDYRDDEEAAKILQMYRDLLSACREDGIDLAFHGVVPLDIPINEVIDYINAKEWSDAKQMVIDKRDILLTEEADQVFSLLLQRHRDNPDLIDKIKESRELLARCRREGIDAAFSDRCIEVPENVANALWGYINAPTWNEAEQIIRANQDILFTDVAQNFFSMLLRLAETNNDRGMLSLMLSRREALLRAKKKGIDDAFRDYR